jgi:tetratricopeptide (TPR) repeat protein
MPLYREALSLRPEDADIWTSQGEMFSELGRAEEALACYDKAIELRPDRRLPRINKARQLVVAGRKAEGVKEFSELVSAFAGEPVALNEIAVGLCAVNLQERAIPLFQEALRLRPAEAAIFLCNIGNALLEMDREMESLGWYEHAIKADPKYISAYMQSAKAHHRVGNLKECVDWYAKALEIDTRNAECWFGRGSTFLEMGEHRPAIECFDNALKVQPSHKQVLYNKGVALLGMERPEEALACFTKAVQVDSRYAGAWYVKAHVEKSMGKKDAAIASCRAYLGLKTGQVETQRANVAAWLAELSR